MARHLSRRTFLKSSALAGATFAIAGTKSSGRILGANDRIRMAVAGINGRGQSHLGEFGGMKDVEITYLVDPDTRLHAKNVKKLKEKTGTTPKAVVDCREALDDANVDAISIATPNHWHALMTIWACERGKDVYVEKPCSHNVHEGRIAVEMARKHGCIVQHGTQSRSSESWARVAAAIKSGQLGKLLVSRALCYKTGGGGSTRGNIGFASPKAAPEGLDFNVWLGPAREQPYHDNLVHYRWHWFWDFGNGDLGNQGVHQMDIARWAIPGATLPTSAFSLGGRFVGPDGDQGEAANTQVAVLDFGGTLLVFEVRGLKSSKYLGQDVGNIFHLEAGTIRGSKYYPKDSDKEAPLPKVEVARGPGDGNFANFIAAVRSRKVGDLNADIEEGHYSSALCHLANISHRLGKDVPFDARRQAFSESETVNDAFGRMQEHLKENGLKLAETKYRLGRVLEIDAATESIVDDREASQLLTRNYRAPFAVPDKVA